MVGKKPLFFMVNVGWTQSNNWLFLICSSSFFFIVGRCNRRRMQLQVCKSYQLKGSYAVLFCFASHRWKRKRKNSLYARTTCLNNFSTISKHLFRSTTDRNLLSCSIVGHKREESILLLNVDLRPRNPDRTLFMLLCHCSINYGRCNARSWSNSLSLRITGNGLHESR